MKISKNLLRAIAYLPIYVACIAPAALMWQRPVALALLYAVIAVGLLLWRHSASDLVYFFVPFFFGPAGEYFAVQQGAWNYNGSTTLPIWLPFVWGIAGLFMKNVSETLAGRDVVEEASGPLDGPSGAMSDREGDSRLRGSASSANTVS